MSLDENMTDELDKIKKIISEKFGVSDTEINLNSDLTSDLNLSSLEINDLIAEISNDFNLTLPHDNEIDKIKTVQDVISFIDAYSQEL